MKNRKGIILAGGSGSRLRPLTKALSKQILPIYDKPMIYYPISTLMNAGIREILIITTPRDVSSYKYLLGSGETIGLNISYAVQNEPNGIAEAFIIGERFIADNSVSLILGDNIFIGEDFIKLLNNNDFDRNEATIFAIESNEPERFGVIEIDQNGQPIAIEEKPKFPKSNNIITGLYFYDNQVVNFAKDLNPSKRGELEITDINKKYLDKKTLKVQIINDKNKWIDAGTHESLISASNYVKNFEDKKKYKLGCLEEIAYNKKWINQTELENLIDINNGSSYAIYLRNILNNEY